MSKNNKRNIEKARVECKIMTMLENGRKEINTKKQLEKYPLGSMISYMNKSNIFRLGGFITKFAEEYFIYITPDFKTRYRTRYQNIQKMWVGNVYEVTNDLVSIVGTSRNPTKHEVKINDIVVYYGNDSFDAKRFRCTEKYKRMVSWNKYFNDNN